MATTTTKFWDYTFNDETEQRNTLRRLSKVNAMANPERELKKFITNPKFRERALARAHDNCDAAYRLNVHNKEVALSYAKSACERRIQTLRETRWQSLAEGRVHYSTADGLIRINNVNHYFTSIKGADLNQVDSYRTVTCDRTTTKSKKHVSLLGGVAGAAVAGPVGAVVGGVALGKTSSKGGGNIYEERIPTCTHIGVKVDIDGFCSEVVFLDSRVDQDSPAYKKAYIEASELIQQLGQLAKTPVPEVVVQVEQDPSVLELEAKIEEAKQQLDSAIADTPKYEIPAIYRTAEQKDLSDAEYLEYLKAEDARREEEKIQAAEARAREKQANAAARAEARAKTSQERAERRQAHKDACAKEKQANASANADKNAAAPLAPSDTAATLKKVGAILGKAILWVASLFALMLSVVAFNSISNPFAGLFLLAGTVLVNPLFYSVLAKRGIIAGSGKMLALFIGASLLCAFIGVIIIGVCYEPTAA